METDNEKQLLPIQDVNVFKIYKDDIKQDDPRAQIKRNQDIYQKSVLRVRRKISLKSVILNFRYLFLATLFIFEISLSAYYGITNDLIWEIVSLAAFTVEYSFLIHLRSKALNQLKEFAVCFPNLILYPDILEDYRRNCCVQKCYKFRNYSRAYGFIVLKDQSTRNKYTIALSFYTLAVIMTTLLLIQKNIIALMLFTFPIMILFGFYSYQQYLYYVIIRSKIPTKAAQNAQQVKRIGNFAEVEELNESLAENLQTNCVICYEDFVASDNIVVLPCNDSHNFHLQCIQDWLVQNQTCPLCRANVPLK